MSKFTKALGEVILGEIEKGAISIEFSGEPFVSEIEKAQKRQVGETKVGADGITRIWTDIGGGKMSWRRVRKTKSTPSGSGNEKPKDGFNHKEWINEPIDPSTANGSKLIARMSKIEGLERKDVKSGPKTFVKFVSEPPKDKANKVKSVSQAKDYSVGEQIQFNHDGKAISGRILDAPKGEDFVVVKLDKKIKWVDEAHRESHKGNYNYQDHMSEKMIDSFEVDMDDKKFNFKNLRKKAEGGATSTDYTKMKLADLEKEVPVFSLPSVKGYAAYQKASSDLKKDNEEDGNKLSQVSKTHNDMLVKRNADASKEYRKNLIAYLEKNKRKK